jgi:sugar/nucleoside kinase (ribokinase family)
MDVVTLGIVCADVMVRPIESFPERGKLSHVPTLEIHLGGLAAVTATVLSQLGAKSAFIGCTGNDGFGDYLMGVMTGNGVDVSQVRRTSEYGSSATVVLVAHDGERTFLHHMGANRLVSEQDVDLEFVSRARVLHWGGPSVNPGLDGEPIGRVLEKARARGLTTSMDTCFDGQGKWFQLIKHALPHLDIVMSSLEEARNYTGKQTPEEIADFYRSFGVETVLVKLGADGVFAKNSKGQHRLPAHKVKVVDTTGAGDAACGGFLYGYLHGWGLLECAKMANAVGALTVQQMGGAEAVKSLEQVKALMENAQ